MKHSPSQQPLADRNPVALIHGGPGSPGPINRLKDWLHPIQPTKVLHQRSHSLAALIQELHHQLKPNNKRWILIGHSAGAWLSGLYAIHHPENVLKLIWIGAGPIENRYVQTIHQTRLERLPADQQNLFLDCMDVLNGQIPGDMENTLSLLQSLVRLTDNRHPDPAEQADYPIDRQAFLALSAEWNQLRASGALSQMFRSIPCPVISLHGEYDPHPAAGVSEPMQSHPSFTQIILPTCGHTPWCEQYGSDFFFQKLKEMLK